jgi:hypothetical protein
MNDNHTFHCERTDRHGRHTAHVSTPSWRNQLEAFPEERCEFLTVAQVERQSHGGGYEPVEFDPPGPYWV